MSVVQYKRARRGENFSEYFTLTRSSFVFNSFLREDSRIVIEPFISKAARVTLMKNGGMLFISRSMQANINNSSRNANP